MSEVLNQISENRVFKHLKEESLQEISNRSVLRRFDAGEFIVNQGEVWPRLFMVIEGEIHAVMESQSGRVLIATTIHPGEIFWGLAFFIENAMMPVSLQANSASSIIIWTREDLVPIIKENGRVSWSICQVMINRMQLASEIVEELAFQPVMSRLSGLLLEVFGEAEGEFVSRELTLDDMAAHIGTTREMVCRHLYRLAENGAIEISRTELKINDRSFLEDQASKV
ncbi:MAG: cyclic nucleotide-binding domain-containing protein [Anaerolineales bacterium]|nr:cyclic nucleotide-binding domain-containing protein [Anaerolineales bacterium]